MYTLDMVTTLALIIFRDHAGKILLQFRDSSTAINPLNWGFFGGHMDEGEVPLQAVLREAKEELGIELAESDIRLVIERPWTHEVTGDEKSVFLYEALQPIKWTDIDLNEGSGAAFFTKEEIAKLGEISSLPKTFIAEYC